MDISEELTCLFTAEVEEHGQSYVLEVPKQEVDVGYVDPTEDYQVALVGTSEKPSQPSSSESSNDRDHQPEADQPPVSKGETRVVGISELGDQGDGLARVERGFIVIVPETEKGQRVRIQIETVRETVAFGHVIEHLDRADSAASN
ncbi:TRAM domain-containing protein [Halohasta litorea]|uniref:TRAM domain-containing protein n=1 Tax=Halohasta litorea TaxID=869891 RepID=A0ABD6DC61_9EURY|nr:TRAM domain-containing protein [Halohasta litorea]